MYTAISVLIFIICVLLILIVSIISLIILMLEFNPKNMQGSQEYSIITAIEEKTITADFLLSYILPLFAFDFTVWSEVVLFLVFFFVFAFSLIVYFLHSLYLLFSFISFPACVHITQYLHQRQGGKWSGKILIPFVGIMLHNL